MLGIGHSPPGLAASYNIVGPHYKGGKARTSKEFAFFALLFRSYSAMRGCSHSRFVPEAIGHVPLRCIWEQIAKIFRSH